MKFFILILLCTIEIFYPVCGLGEGVVDINAILGIFNGVANIFTDVNTTDNRVARMLGKWHQMYKAAINFDVYQSNMYCQVAYFSRNKVMGPEGFSITEAFHVDTKNGQIETFKRDLQKVGPGEYWMYTEEYFYPRQFYILKIGPQKLYDRANDTVNSTVDNNSTTGTSRERYEYLVATDSNRLALMVYARDPEQFRKLYEKEVQTFLNKQGFGGYVFWNQPISIYQNTDCYYPSEKEVFVRRSLKNSQQPYVDPLNDRQLQQPPVEQQFHVPVFSNQPQRLQQPQQFQIPTISDALQQVQQQPPVLPVVQEVPPASPNNIQRAPPLLPNFFQQFPLSNYIPQIQRIPLDVNSFLQVQQVPFIRSFQQLPINFGLLGSQKTISE